MRIFLEVIFVIRVASQSDYNTNNVPFKCPYQPPEGDPKPTTDLTIKAEGGLDPSLFTSGGLDDEPQSTYAQYRAALALVPCNSRALSVFPKDQLGSNFTVAVIFVYEKSVEEIKHWLK